MTWRNSQLALPASPPRPSDRFTDLRSKYLKLGIYHQKAFNACYTKFASADDLFRQFPDDLNGRCPIKIADDLAANQVFDVSQKTIRAKLKRGLKRWRMASTRFVIAISP